MHVHFLEWWRVNQSSLVRSLSAAVAVTYKYISHACYTSSLFVRFMHGFCCCYSMVHGGTWGFRNRKDDDEYFMHFKLLNSILTSHSRIAFASNAHLIWPICDAWLWENWCQGRRMMDSNNWRLVAITDRDINTRLSMDCDWTNNRDDHLAVLNSLSLLNKTLITSHYIIT